MCELVQESTGNHVKSLIKLVLYLYCIVLVLYRLSLPNEIVIAN